MVRDVNPESCGGPGRNPGCPMGVPLVWLYSGTSSLLARAGVALPGAGPFLRNFGDRFFIIFYLR